MLIEKKDAILTRGTFCSVCLKKKAARIVALLAAEKESLEPTGSEAAKFRSENTHMEELKSNKSDFCVQKVIFEI